MPQKKSSSAKSVLKDFESLSESEKEKVLGGLREKSKKAGKPAGSARTVVTKGVKGWG